MAKKLSILLTGSEGSLAQTLIPYLQKAGHTVVGVDNFSRYGRIRRKRTYRFLQCDLADSSPVKKIFRLDKFDAIIHLAALVYGVGGINKKAADILADNALITLNLLKYGKHAVGKFIYLSSSMVYEGSKQLPHREEDVETAQIMSTAYGLSKYVGEKAVISFWEQYGLKYTIWRPFNIIAPFEKAQETGLSHVYADMVRKILIDKQNPVEILGDGTQTRCFTDSHDVADAISRFSFDKRSDNQVFNIGNTEALTIKQLAEEIVKIGKRRHILPDDYELQFTYLRGFEHDVKLRIPDVTKMQQVFDWQTRTSVEDSLEHYIDRNVKTEHEHPSAFVQGR